jgi:hypothetical protein
MCQGCVSDEGITQRAYDFIEAFRQKWPRSEFGPAHIVIADDNLEDEHIKWCIALCDSILDGAPWPENWDYGHYWPDHEREEFVATREFLRELLAWPLDDRLGPEAEVFYESSLHDNDE